MAILAIDARANQHRVRRYVEQRGRINGVFRTMMRSGENVRFQRVAEYLVDPFPSRDFGVAGDQIGKSAQAKARELEDDAAIVGIVHVLDVRREQFEGEIVGQAA